MRKLILMALTGTFILGMGTLGMAATTSDFTQSGARTEDFLGSRIQPVPLDQRTINPADTSDFPPTMGSDASDWLGSEAQGGARNVSHPVTSDFTETRGTGAGDWVTGGSGSASAGGKGYTGYYRYDSRDPQNGVIRPGGRIVYP